MSERLDRARMLLQVERHAEAARELTALLAEEPQHPGAHALLALSLAVGERWEEGLEAARTAVSLAPDWYYAHFVLGTILCDAGRPKEALASAREARRLEPEDADVHALVARCFGVLGRWKEVLVSARRGLEVDPKHVDSLNLRAQALRLLGRTDDARGALDIALAEDPEDPDTHASYGFARLQEGDGHQALEHFREALRLDPSHEAARAGLAEALKARNPLYRPILWWMLFSARFNRRQSVLVIVGLLFGARALAKTFASVPGLELLAAVVVFGYLFLMWTSWVGTALFDLLLWLRRDTRDVLLQQDRNCALMVGGAILAALLIGGTFTALGLLVEGLLGFAALMAVAIPIAGASSVGNRRARGFAVALAGILAAGTLLGLALAAYDAEQPLAEGAQQSKVGLGVLALAFVGSLLSSWVMMGLRMIRPRPLA